MWNLLKNFFKEDEGGADQLIIAAILVVVGIGIAVLFGDQIYNYVTDLLGGMEKPDTDKYKQMPTTSPT